MADDQNGTFVIVVGTINEGSLFDDGAPGWHVAIGKAGGRNISNYATGDFFHDNIDV